MSRILTLFTDPLSRTKGGFAVEDAEENTPGAVGTPAFSRRVARSAAQRLAPASLCPSALCVLCVCGYVTASSESCFDFHPDATT
jgi:hypothetical protein